MENTIKAKVSATWANATSLATKIQTACANSGKEFKFVVALVGEKKIPAGGTSAVTSYSVNAKVGFDTSDFTSIQSLEETIHTACENAKKSGTEIKFKTYTGLGDSSV